MMIAITDESNLLREEEEEEEKEKMAIAIAAPAPAAAAGQLGGRRAGPRRLRCSAHSVSKVVESRFVI